MYTGVSFLSLLAALLNVKDMNALTYFGGTHLSLGDFLLPFLQGSEQRGKFLKLFK